MENKDKPAFPLHPGHNGKYNEWEGISKREYFAVMAMQGLLANPYHIQTLMENEGITDKNRMLVMGSIDCADELLKQLEQ